MRPHFIRSCVLLNCIAVSHIVVAYDGLFGPKHVVTYHYKTDNIYVLIDRLSNTLLCTNIRLLTFGDAVKY
jgi:hypothetical protein